MTVAYNQYCEAPLRRFAAHVDSFNARGPAVPSPDALDHHGSPAHSMQAYRAVALRVGHQRPDAPKGPYDFVFDFERAFATE